MRDLDRLQEQDPDGRKRILSTSIAFGALALLLSGIVLWSMHRGAANHSARDADELRALEVVHKVVQPARAPSAENPDEQASTATHTALDTLQPEAPVEPDDRPEVEAALAAADREEQQLAAAAEARAAQRRAAARSGEERAGGIPASLSASSAGHELAKTANEDQLVAAALPKTTGPRGSEGNEGAQGEFALQVISFETRDAADGFARALRGKGHNAYVLPAHADGRGRYFRVRVGPFKTRGAAEAYRREFDEREHMNTILVRRQE